jgi:hypothetical protein
VHNLVQMAAAATSPRVPVPVASARHGDDHLDLMAVGVHCQVAHCRQLDFLPVTCSHCKRVTCDAHASDHACAATLAKRNEVRAFVWLLAGRAGAQTQLPFPC